MLHNSIYKVCLKLASLSLGFTLFLSNLAVAEEILEVNFAYVGSAEHAALLGIQQGLDEANLQGEFLNQRYNLSVVTPEESAKHDFSTYVAVLSAAEQTDYLELTERLTGTAVFNLTLDDDKLRMSCINNALHIIPSKAMKLDAEAQWQKKAPDNSAKAQAWHPAFVKFAARDLNKRFKKNHKITMDDYSWSGWAAVKMTSDTVARTSITDPNNMLNYLKTELSFDGQKGSDMNFRETGQLRQLMLLIDENEIVAEAPVRGVAKPPSLDSLGILNCEK